MSAVGPNLSHWPGNRTPQRFKADLSTGICLRFAAAERAVQEEFLAGAEAVLNDHYDTDGYGSLLAVLRPELALERQDELLRAAATGDYQVFVDEAAFAVDRCILHLAAPDSPLAGRFAGLEDGAKMLARYRWLVDEAETLLDGWQAGAHLYAAELAELRRDLERPDIEVKRLPELELCLLRSRGPVHRMALNTLAEGCYRVLHSFEMVGGWCFRYHDRTESWFELVSFEPLARKDLRPLALDLEARMGGADAAVRWCADGPNQPIPELYHGIPAAQEYGSITRELRPLDVDPASIEAILQAFHGADAESSPGKS